MVLIFEKQSLENDLKDELKQSRKLVSLCYDEITIKKIRELFLTLVPFAVDESRVLCIYYIDSDGDELPISIKDDLMIFLEQEKAMVLHAKIIPKVKKQQILDENLSKTQASRTKIKGKKSKKESKNRKKVELKKTLKKRPSRMYLVQDPFTDFKILFKFLEDYFNIQKNYEIGKLVYEKCGDQIADILIQATKQICTQNEIAVVKGKERLKKFEEEKQVEEETKLAELATTKGNSERMQKSRKKDKKKRKNKKFREAPIDSHFRLKNKINSIIHPEDDHDFRSMKHEKKQKKHRKHNKNKLHQKKQWRRENRYLPGQQWLGLDAYRKTQLNWNPNLPDWRKKLQQKWNQLSGAEVGGGGKESESCA